MKLHADDLFHTPLDQAQIDFENEGGETYICGNPPYLGKQVADRTSRRRISNAIFDGSRQAIGDHSTMSPAGS